MSETNTKYALGRSPREYARLAIQADLLKSNTRRVFEDAGIAPGMRVLDLGSGAGDICLLLSEIIGPSGAVVGLDVDSDAIQHAQARVSEAGLSNITFAHSDPGHYSASEPFDAVVGRLVLCYLPDPAATLRALSQFLRPGGIVAFQEFWMMPSMGPDSLIKRLNHTMVETMRRSGAALDLGPRLHRVFLDAGLPLPAMRLEMLMDGREDSPIYQYLAECLNSILPSAVEYGIATAEDFDTESLPRRLSLERQATGYAMMGLPLVAAWCRKP